MFWLFKAFLFKLFKDSVTNNFCGSLQKCIFERETVILRKSDNPVSITQTDAVKNLSLIC